MAEHTKSEEEHRAGCIRVAIDRHAVEGQWPNAKWRYKNWEALRRHYEATGNTALSVKSDAMFKRWADEAFFRGLVRVVELPQKPKYHRNEDLERRLADRFEQRALVVSVDDASAGPEYDDRMHRALGCAMAEALVVSAIPQGSVVGVGSGRGVYDTIEGLEALAQPLIIPSATVVSLTGLVYAQPHMASLPFGLDADTHGLLLVRLIHSRSGPVSFHQVCHAIGRPGRSREQLLVGTPLDSDSWKARRPSLALVGIGVLAPGHRFYTQGGQGEQLLPPEVVELLTQLIQLSDHTQRAHNYYPVGDICNHLFVVDPPRDRPIADHRRMKALVDEINGRLLNVDSQQLSEIPSLYVVAGTMRKVPAIRHVLQTQKNIGLLCVDAAAAEALLVC